MKTAVLTVFYPGMEIFLDNYIECINTQSDRNFECVIVDDAFPGDINIFTKAVKVKTHIISNQESPQKNRLFGLQHCLNKGFDVVVCSDSDETMQSDRVEKVNRYFKENDRENILFANSVAAKDGHVFDLNYKAVLQLADIIDFNVLGYGAMSLRASVIPFILAHENHAVIAVDWWLGMQFLLHFGQVTFREDIRNNYTFHDDSFVGPIFDVTTSGIQNSIRVKINIYEQMAEYCLENGFEEKGDIFAQKLEEMRALRRYLAENKIDVYRKSVESYLKKQGKIFWWQEAVSLNKLK